LSISLYAVAVRSEEGAHVSLDSSQILKPDMNCSHPRTVSCQSRKNSERRDKTLPQPTLGLPRSIDSGDAESLRNRLFSLFIFVEFLGHFYEFLSSNSFSICQESSPSKDTLLSMCRVKLVHEQITWKVSANPTVLDSACCASVQFAFAPERMSILVAASRTAWFLLSIQEGACSAIRATRCNKFIVHSFRLGY